MSDGPTFRPQYSPLRLGLQWVECVPCSLRSPYQFRACRFIIHACTAAHLHLIRRVTVLLVAAGEQEDFRSIFARAAQVLQVGWDRATSGEDQTKALLLACCTRSHATVLRHHRLRLGGRNAATMSSTAAHDSLGNASPGPGGSANPGTPQFAFRILNAVTCRTHLAGLFSPGTTN
jgi:hypothetical protein